MCRCGLSCRKVWGWVLSKGDVDARGGDFGARRETVHVGVLHSWLHDKHASVGELEAFDAFAVVIIDDEISFGCAFGIKAEGYDVSIHGFGISVHANSVASIPI